MDLNKHIELQKEKLKILKEKKQQKDKTLKERKEKLEQLKIIKDEINEIKKPLFYKIKKMFSGGY